MAAVIIGIFLTVAGIELARRDGGKWYEYIAAVIIGILVTIGLCLI